MTKSRHKSDPPRDVGKERYFLSRAGHRCLHAEDSLLNKKRVDRSFVFALVVLGGGGEDAEY